MDKENLMTAAKAAGELEDQTLQTYSPSRLINWSRDIKSPLFDAVLNGICEEIEAKEIRKRKRTKAKPDFVKTVRAFVLDLYVARKSNKRMQLGLPLNKNEYSPANNYHKIVRFYQSMSLSYIDVRSAYKGLEACGYLRTEKKGHFDKEIGKGKRTRIRATRKLISILEERAHITLWQIRRLEGCNNIVLKNENKDIISYEASSQTTQMSNNLKRINELFSNTWIDLYLTDTEFDALKRRILHKHFKDNEASPSVDFSARTLKRVFNNSSWNEGGRFYGGWWQGVPSEYRKHIHINGKATVELDYSGIHPAMIYAEVGVTPPPNPYDMGLKVDREIKKMAFNALVNASSMNIKQNSNFDAESAGCSWREFLEAIINAHPPIRKFFGTGYGVQLQKKDADIAEKVMLRFTKIGYACLPVHDSFLVHHALAEELKEQMEYYYEELVGTSAKVDHKSIFTYKAPAEPEFVDMENIDNFYSGGEYSEYANREAQWYAYTNIT